MAGLLASLPLFILGLTGPICEGQETLWERQEPPQMQVQGGGLFLHFRLASHGCRWLYLAEA